MTMPELYPANDSANIVEEVCSIKHNMNGHEPHLPKEALNGHVVHNTCHAGHTNGDVEHISCDVEHINCHNGYANGNTEHSNGFMEETVNGHYFVEEMNGNVEHVDIFSKTKVDFRDNIDTSSSVPIKQTDQGRHVTTDSQPHTQGTNGATMYDLCEQLSSVGMEDCVMENPMDRQIQPSSCFHDNIEHGQTVFQWSHSNVFSQDKDGDTCLHIAVILQEINLVFTLINTSLTHRSLSTRNNLSQTPLYLAVLTNQITAVRRLMVGGAEIDSRDRYGNTALHLACAKGNRDIAATLMEPVRYHEIKLNKNYEIPYQKIPQNLEIANYEGKPVLHLAAENGHLDIVKMLIEKGADINARDGKTGRTILHGACLEGNIELARCLLSYRDCNLNARAYDDYTPFDFARIRCHTEVAIMLAHAGARNSEDHDFSE